MSIATKLDRLPVSILPTFVGVATLGNVYAMLGYGFIQHFSMILAMFVLIMYICKMVKFPKVIVKDYQNQVSASLFSGFTMLLMSIGNYITNYNHTLGETLWLIGIWIHICHIILFSYKYIIKGWDWDSFLPSSFVTYAGLLVSVVVGDHMGDRQLLTYIVYFGIIAYFTLLPIIIYRLVKLEVKLHVYHTMAVVLSPCSLCLAGYIGVVENKSLALITVLYGCIMISLLFIVAMLPKFFAISFNPGFAGMTFPMAIGVIASIRMSEYLMITGNTLMGNIVHQIAGVQIYLTTMTVSYVVLNFIIEACGLERKAIR